MAGLVRSMLEKIITERAKGNPTIANTTRTKLILKGLNPERFDASAPDDPATVQKVRAAALEFGVTV